MVWERTPAVLQSVVDRAPHAPRYYSDAALVYRELSYWGQHAAMYNKSETYAVEAVNADLRIICTARKSSRCFSEPARAQRAVDLSCAATSRQLRKRK